MDFSTKIRMGEAVAKMSEAELARKIGTTPQAFNQRVKTGKFKYEELESIASALGAELVLKFRFSDGTEVYRKSPNRMAVRARDRVICGAPGRGPFAAVCVRLSFPRAQESR